MCVTNDTHSWWGLWVWKSTGVWTAVERELEELWRSSAVYMVEWL